MKRFLVQTQKIKATCIVRHESKILLLRSNQVVNKEHRPKAGYFGVPSFTISFGEEPEVALLTMLQDYCNQPIENLSMIDVRQYMSEDKSVQTFEIIYSAKSTYPHQANNKYDTFLFVHADELDAYMFPSERESLEKYLR
jgi:hypothetical protein